MSGGGERFSWLGDPQVVMWCVTFVRGASPVEALRRLGAEPVSEKLTAGEAASHPTADEGAWIARAAELDPGWSVVVELLSWQGARPELLEPLAADTEVVSVFSSGSGADVFHYAAGGQVVTWFEPTMPESCGGTEPDRFAEAMQRVGLGADEEFTSGPGGALELIRQEFGVELDRHLVLDAPLVAGLVRD
ncbi:DUF6461 domain-containing protein [Saccharopolyspora cebuensis]|uniref:DUF6461 domain-containing protein n=2 Tax=Saccharopolyspora cebuensis TaxID=418759 RepID=UPI0033702E78